MPIPHNDEVLVEEKPKGRKGGQRKWVSSDVDAQHHAAANRRLDTPTAKIPKNEDNKAKDSLWLSARTKNRRKKTRVFFKKGEKKKNGEKKKGTNRNGI